MCGVGLDLLSEHRIIYWLPLQRIQMWTTTNIEMLSLVLLNLRLPQPKGPTMPKSPQRRCTHPTHMHHVNESRMHVHALVNGSSQFCCVQDSSNTTALSEIQEGLGSTLPPLAVTALTFVPLLSVRTAPDSRAPKGFSLFHLHFVRVYSYIVSSLLSHK